MYSQLPLYQKLIYRNTCLYRNEFVDLMGFDITRVNCKWLLKLPEYLCVIIPGVPLCYSFLTPLDNILTSLPYNCTETGLIAVRTLVVPLSIDSIV